MLGPAMVPLAKKLGIVPRNAVERAMMSRWSRWSAQMVGAKVMFHDLCIDRT
jgi:hypothetical protein